jgi:hypothetical protein
MREPFLSGGFIRDAGIRSDTIQNTNAAPEKENGSSAPKTSDAGSDENESDTTELFSIAFELSDATETCLKLLAEPGVEATEIRNHSTELLAAYDEYLEVLADELGAPQESTATDSDTARLVREDLIRLHARFECSRELLLGLFAVAEEQLSGNDSEAAADEPNELNAEPR